MSVLPRSRGKRNKNGIKKRHREQTPLEHEHAQYYCYFFLFSFSRIFARKFSFSVLCEQLPRNVVVEKQCCCCCSYFAMGMVCLGALDHEDLSCTHRDTWGAHQQSIFIYLFFQGKGKEGQKMKGKENTLIQQASKHTLLGLFFPFGKVNSERNTRVFTFLPPPPRLGANEHSFIFLHILSRFQYFSMNLLVIILHPHLFSFSF